MTHVARSVSKKLTLGLIFCSTLIASGAYADNPDLTCFDALYYASYYPKDKIDHTDFKNKIDEMGDAGGYAIFGDLYFETAESRSRKEPYAPREYCVHDAPTSQTYCWQTDKKAEKSQELSSYTVRLVPPGKTVCFEVIQGRPVLCSGRPQYYAAHDRSASKPTGGTVSPRKLSPREEDKLLTQQIDYLFKKTPFNMLASPNELIQNTAAAGRRAAQWLIDDNNADLSMFRRWVQSKDPKAQLSAKAKALLDKGEQEGRRDGEEAAKSIAADNCTAFINAHPADRQYWCQMKAAQGTPCPQSDTTPGAPARPAGSTQ